MKNASVRYIAAPLLLTGTSLLLPFCAWPAEPFTADARITRGNTVVDVVFSGGIRLLPGGVQHCLEVFSPEFKGTEAWTALVCDAQCSLQPVTLVARPVTAVEDGEPTPAQELALLKPARGQVIALFDGLPGNGKGPLSTSLHAGMPTYPDAGTAGTLEIGIVAPSGDNTRVVPRYTPEKQTVSIYLESATARQKLGEQDIRSGARLLYGRELLLWAGDMDGDNRLDLLLNLPEGLTLFLSSLATDGAMVGLAGRYSSQGGDEGRESRGSCPAMPNY